MTIHPFLQGDGTKATLTDRVMSFPFLSLLFMENELGALFASPEAIFATLQSRLQNAAPVTGFLPHITSQHGRPKTQLAE